jgi:hypothetical protein
MRKRILLVTLEFPRWTEASRWAYPANMGMESALICNDVDYYLLPATHGYGGKVKFWIDYAHSLLRGRKFDQVWLEIVHSAFDEEVLGYLCSLAPVRLGWAFESLVLRPEEWRNNPNACRIREAALAKRLPLLTHLLTMDEVDAARLRATMGARVEAMPPGFVMPRECIREEPGPPAVNLGLFYGTIYGERKKWLELPKLTPLLRYCPSSPEVQTPLPAAFDRLHARAIELSKREAVDQRSLEAYLAENRSVRKQCFELWLDGLRLGAAVVNLPQWGRMYAGRIVEGMAAGRPVIACELPDRPLAKTAFEDGREILLYREVDELASHLERVIRDRHFAQQIARNARERLLASYTSQAYIAQILRWIGD